MALQRRLQRISLPGAACAPAHRRLAGAHVVLGTHSRLGSRESAAQLVKWLGLAKYPSADRGRDAAEARNRRSAQADSSRMRPANALPAPDATATHAPPDDRPRR